MGFQILHSSRFERSPQFYCFFFFFGLDRFVSQPCRQIVSLQSRCHVFLFFFSFFVTPPPASDTCRTGVWRVSDTGTSPPTAVSVLQRLVQLIMKIGLVPLLQWTWLLTGQAMDWICKDLTRDIEDFATLNGVWVTLDARILDKTWLI